MSDLRSLPDNVLKAYLFSLGAWGVILLICWVLNRVGIALTLCYPLAGWLGALTIWWWLRTWRRYRAGELERLEIDAGVRSVGRILAGGALIPGIIFLGNDPLAPASWGTFLGITVVGALAFGLTSVTANFVSSRIIHTAALAIAWAALPINATGAVSVAAMWGWFSVVTEVSPL